MRDTEGNDCPIMGSFCVFPVKDLEKHKFTLSVSFDIKHHFWHLLIYTSDFVLNNELYLAEN
jgi:hypothetical protein